MGFKILDVAQDADGNLIFTIQYPRTTLFTETVLIPAREKATQQNPALADMSNQEYLDDALAKLKIRCQIESTRDIDFRVAHPELIGKLVE